MLAELTHEMVKASREEVARSTSRCGNATGSSRVFQPACRHEPWTAATAQKAKRARKTRKATRNEPTVDLKAELKRICGVGLTSIDGIEVITAQTIISEIGTHMSGFRTEYFASWLGLTPSKDASGGKIVGPGKRKVQNRLPWHCAWRRPSC